MKLTGAEILCQSLEHLGVKHVFGYPGGAILPVYDALGKSKLHHILVRHEQGATHMADGYARASGGVGVAMATSGPGATKPTPIETFLSMHPAAAAFVTTHRPVAVSYGTEPYFGVNALKFTNAQGSGKFGRYRIVPESGAAYVSDEEAAKRSPHALADNLRASIEKAPVKFRLLVQIAAAGDPTNDATKVWPDDRPIVPLGEIAITRALDTAKIENELLFMPTNLTNGIDVSDDPILNTRTEAYSESYRRRTE